MTFRLLHASDLHLGKAFGGFPEGVRHRLREARHGAIARLAQAARQGGAGIVLLAGDTFDAETPSPETLRHALRAMAEATDLRWLVIPGNHDSLAASELWRRVAADAPANLQALTEAAPVQAAPGLWVLPAPCTQRRPGRDLTEAMSAATPEGALRLGLGHGAVTDFSGEEEVPGIIPPDRARLSGLDYLALGDWHGCLQIGPSTWYSGTPEADSFKHPGPASALLVTLVAPGAPVEVTRQPTGSFAWRAAEIDLLPGDPVAERLQSVLPPLMGRRDILMRLVARGRLPLAEQAALRQALAAAAPDFGWCETDLSQLTTETRVEDLDQIDRAGALRQAAEALMAEASDPALAAETRAVATAALSQLFALALEVQP